MYQFSLKFYMKIVNKILREKSNFSHLQNEDYLNRMLVMDKLVYERVFDKIKHSILEKDKDFIALTFAKIRLKFTYGDSYASLMRLFFSPCKLIETSLGE